MHPTFRLWFENLAALGESDREPLSSLEVESHLHGGLRLEIAGRRVPYMGYFGPDDVCIGQWLGVLRGLRSVFSGQGTRYVFDECEQGQPAFVFEREGEQGYFSLADSIACGQADPDWQRVEFKVPDMLSAIAQFEEEFAKELRHECPEVAEIWLQRIEVWKSVE